MCSKRRINLLKLLSACICYENQIPDFGGDDKGSAFVHRGQFPRQYSCRVGFVYVMHNARGCARNKMS